MSSPLSVLKKTRRVPLQGPVNDDRDRHPAPFRRDLLKEFQAELADGKMPDSNAPLPSHTAASFASTSKSNIPLKKAGPPSDFELMSAMMQRITLLEETVRRQAQEIKCRDKKISVLEMKLKEPNESESKSDPCGRDDLERKCQQMQNKVAQLECFLWDHGLIWVESGEKGDSAESQKLRSIKRALLQQDRRFHMNFNLVLQNIKELNALTGERDCFVQPTATGAKLVKQDSVQLTLYSNGIVMFDGPFRSYQEQSTQQCVQDLMDGYLPSELQERFPDGVPFEVHDRRHEEFILRKPNKRFPGVGQAIYGKKVGADHFLNRLPKAVVKAGHVIDIRNSVRDTLQGSYRTQSNSSVTLIDTAALQAMKEREQTHRPEEPASACDVITLKVKSEDGDHTFILKMYFSETIAQLRQYVDKHRGGGLPNYDIISMYPRCRYDDDRQTLQSCGLTTNTTLRLWRRKHQQ